MRMSPIGLPAEVRHLLDERGVRLRLVLVLRGVIGVRELREHEVPIPGVNLDVLRHDVTLLDLADECPGFVEDERHAEMVDDEVVAFPPQTVIAVHRAVNDCPQDFLTLCARVLGAGFAVHVPEYEFRGGVFRVQLVQFVDVSGFKNSHRRLPISFRFRSVVGCRTFGPEDNSWMASSRVLWSNSAEWMCSSIMSESTAASSLI